MSFKINRKHIDNWVDLNGPAGLHKLAQKAQVSSSLLSKVRAGKGVPKNGYMRLRICEAIGVSEEELFVPTATEHTQP
jgi:transcriptional regulator with XRE-family HTH domain